MVRRKLVSLFVCSLVMGAVSMAVAGIPDLTNSTATTAAGTQVSVYCSSVPGVGQTLLQGKNAAGVVTNATITLTLKDGNGDPIFNYPFEDLWLATSLNGFVSCTPTLANGSTNALGMTLFTGANVGKGHSDRNGGEKTVIMIAGTPLSGSQLDILFNSADINADNVVNISDTVLYVTALKGLAADNYYANFNYDGVVNISDTVVYVTALKSILQGCQ